MKTFTVILFSIAAFASGSRGANTVLIKSADFPAIRIRYSELEQILTKSAQLANEANRGEITVSNYATYLGHLLGTNEMKMTHPQYVEERRQQLLRSNPQEELSLKCRGSQIVLNDHGLRNAENLPEGADEVIYTYLWNFPNAPVRRITIRFTDFFRTMEVEGCSEAHVAAVLNSAAADFNVHSTILGGEKFRFALGFSTSMAFILLASMFTITIRLNTLRGGGVFITCVAIGVGIMFFPFKSLLPGFAAYSSDPSFLVRYSPELTFWGLILSVIGVVLAVYQIAMAAKKPNAAGAKQKNKPISRRLT